VQQLSFHVEEKQSTYFKGKESIKEVLERIANQDSQFMAWLTLNRNDAIGKNGKRGRDILYADIPAYFTWDGTNKMWNKRSRGFSLGRINYVPKKLEDEYFLIVLLNIVKGPHVLLISRPTMVLSIHLTKQPVLLVVFLMMTKYTLTVWWMQVNSALVIS